MLLLRWAPSVCCGLRTEVQRLRNIERELTSEKNARADERRLQQHELLVAKRHAAMAEVAVEVWSGAFNEAQEAGSFPPSTAILARQEVLLEAKNLHIPLPPPP